MDQTALKDRARACAPCQISLRELGPHLPADDAALDRLVGELVTDREALAFTNIIVAAVVAGRPVEARHLEQGAALFVDPAFLVAAAMHLRGDVAGALVRACAAGRMGVEREVTALLVAAVWRQAAPDRPLPEDLVPLARARARKALGEPLTLGLLAALVDLVPDEGLRTVIKAEVPPNFQALGQGLRETLIEPALQDPLAILPVHPPPAAYSGSTLRRSGPKVRRNDPCPCGSGRKYKHCCLEPDQQRERAETFTALGGLPIEKILAQPEQHLTRERLRSLRSYELERLDPDTVPRELRTDLLHRLSLFHEFDLMVKHLEHWGWGGVNQLDWEQALFGCCEAGRRDLAERLVALPGPDRPADLEIPLFAQVCLNEDNPAILLKLIETTWAAALREPEVKGMAWMEACDLAHSLLNSSRAVLGIALAHGLIPLTATGEGLELIESVLSARDRLNLPPHEPVEDVLDRLLMEPSSSDEDAEEPEVAQARAALEAKAREAERLRRDLAEAQHELQRQERLRVRAEKRSAAVAPATDQASEATPPPELADLRRRLKTLKTDLTERRQEQNELRRQLDAERQKMVRLEESSAAAPATATGPEESDALLPVETTGPQPVRVPEFPAGWPGAVDTLPMPVVRAAVVLAGRLAAGETAAFRGTKRLRRDRELLRQKVGRDHRLLFRLLPGKLTVVELLNRRDFETRLKALT